MLESMFWGGFLRGAQALLQASPFILTGLLIAGVFRRLFSHEALRKMFGHGTWRALPQAWAIGMLLPDLFPGGHSDRPPDAARRIERRHDSGVRLSRTAVQSALVALRAHAIATRNDLRICVMHLGGRHVRGADLGLAVSTFRRSRRIAPARAIWNSADAGGGRCGAREVAGPTLPLLLVGLFGVVALSWALPPGSLQRAMGHENPWAPLLMAAIALPAYATPMMAMSQLGSMFQHGNSVGAAFTLLTLGAGTNLGLVLWMHRSYGLRKMAVWLGLLLAVIIGLSYGVEKPLYPTAFEAANHTHAFDVYCRPFKEGTANLPGACWIRFARTRRCMKFMEPSFSAPCWSRGLRCGVSIAVTGSRRGSNDLFPTRSKTGLRDFVLPAPVLGLAALAILVGLSVVGCYAYYPAPGEALDQITTCNTETLAAALVGNRKQADHWIPIYADWVRKLQVGLYLRTGEVSEYRRMKARVLQDRLELLEHELADNDREAVHDLIHSISIAERRLRIAFMTESKPAPQSASQASAESLH